MSAISAAMSGIKAASARLETSAETLVNQSARTAARPADAAPPQKVQTTPAPKVYRPMRANLFTVANSTGGGGGVAVDPEPARLELIQASGQYRASLKALQTARDMEASALDINA